MKYIAKQAIIDLCEQSDLRPGARVFRQWWGQAGLDLVGAKKGAAALAL